MGQGRARHGAGQAVRLRFIDVFIFHHKTSRLRPPSLRSPRPFCFALSVPLSRLDGTLEAKQRERG